MTATCDLAAKIRPTSACSGATVESWSEVSEEGTIARVRIGNLIDKELRDIEYCTNPSADLNDVLCGAEASTMCSTSASSRPGASYVTVEKAEARSDSRASFATMMSWSQDSETCTGARRTVNGLIENGLLELAQGNAEAAITDSKNKLRMLLKNAVLSGSLGELLGSIPDSGAAVAEGNSEMDSLRGRLKCSLFDAVDTGRLDDIMADAVDDRAEPLPLVPVSAVPEIASGEFHLLKKISERDRRIGELSALIIAVQGEIHGRDDMCRQLTQLVAAARTDVAHFTLSLDEQKDAFAKADERGAELEAKRHQFAKSLRQNAHCPGSVVRTDLLQNNMSLMSGSVELSAKLGGLDARHTLELRNVS